jgi:3-hydroxymyristoyl/3-hydroxydecanoyl-(acyl carrier protein) dehydratase
MAKDYQNRTTKLCSCLWFNRWWIFINHGVLPHRPLLLIDRIIEMSESHVVGMKCYHEWKFLCGHFSEAPVMPGF